MKQSYIIIILIGLLNFNCQSNASKKETPVKPLKAKAEIKIDSKTKETSTVNNKKTKTFTYGIDISKYQGDEINFLDKTKDSLQFIICKATEGNTYTDPDFYTNWKMISKKGFIKGAYHFYRSIDEPQPQAANFLKALKQLKNTNLPPIIDFEQGGIDDSQSVSKIQSNLLAFIQIIEKQTGRTPMLYTSPSTGNKYLNNPVFSNYPLWIANYTKAEKPDLPVTWKNKGWEFWQKSQDYTINNINNDFDIFNGNVQTLETFINTTIIK